MHGQFQIFLKVTFHPRYRGYIKAHCGSGERVRGKQNRGKNYGKRKKGKNGCRIVNKQLYFYKSNKQYFFTHFIKFLEWFVCDFENFINQMVKLPRHATEQPTA